MRHHRRPARKTFSATIWVGVAVDSSSSSRSSSAAEAGFGLDEGEPLSNAAKSSAETPCLSEGDRRYPSPSSCARDRAAVHAVVRVSAPHGRAMAIATRSSRERARA